MSATGPELPEDPAELQALLEAVGGGTSDVTAVGPQSPVSTGAVYGGPTYRPGFPIPTGREPGGRVERSVNDLLGQFYRMESPNMMRRLQALLFAGGFYGDMSIEGVRWGVGDSDSFTAWAAAVAQAAQITASDPEGEPLTLQEVIQQAASSGGITLGMGTDEMISALEETEAEEVENVQPIEGDVIELALTDPNRLRKDIDDVASAVLGRKANPGEQRMFVALMHNQERSTQRGLQTAEPEVIFAELDPELLQAAGTDPAAAMALEESLPDPQDVTVEYATPDSAAQAEAFLRLQNPAEAGAHDIAIQFANFMDMLQSPVQVPRTVYGDFTAGGF